MTTPRAELILYNGTIRTLDPHQPDAEALAVANGRITIIGALDAVEATAHANTHRIDLAGRTLLPGFNDALFRFDSVALPTSVASVVSDERAIMQAARQCARRGITSITIVAATPTALDDYRILAAERRLPLRINAVALRYTNDGLKLPLPQRFESNWLRIDTVWLSGDNRNEQLTTSDEKMRAMVWDIHRAGLRAMIHASSESAIEQAISAIEYASQRLASRLRHCIESADHLNDAQIQRCREHRISIVVQPKSENTRLHNLLDSGISVGLGSGDIRSKDEKSPLALLTSLIPNIGIPNALSMYTIGSAAVAGEEGLKGSIAVGKYADFVVLSGDPFRAPTDRLTDLQAEITIMNGQVVHTA